jgi:hypothetical protein
MAKYLWNEKTHKFEYIGDGFTDPNAGLNGPVYCPEQGYYDPVLCKRFETKREKRAYMKENGLMMEGGSKKQTEGNFGKTFYFIPGLKVKSRYYKNR